jgi:hypothetical protein
VQNCLQGSLPQEICQANNLSALAMDGLFTAKSCRDKIFPDFQSISISDSYILKHSLEGTIPNCIYGMKYLTTLHLSGNGIHGSFSSNIKIGSNLKDLTLSHNSLSGTIPTAIQNRKWERLDLSFNKFTGVFSDQVLNGQIDNITFLMDKNRISGKIPSTLLEVTDISILEGNIFQCDFSQKYLPSNDPIASSYNCGSDSFNYSSLVWGFFFFIFGLTTLSIFLFGKLEQSKIKLISSCKKLVEACIGYHQKHYEELSMSLNRPNVHIIMAGRFISRLRRFCLLITSFIIFILAPAYLLLDKFYHT